MGMIRFGGAEGQSVGNGAGVTTSVSPSGSQHWLHIRMKTESLKNTGAWAPPLDQ